MEENYNWQFSDYFRQIIYASDIKHIYLNTGDAPFPPFTYCFFNLLYRINPIDFDEISLDCWRQAQGNNNLLIFFLLFMLVGISLYWIIDYCLEGKCSNIFKGLLYLSVIAAPFMWDGAFERGNMVIVAMVCILLAIVWRDSDNKVKKELAMILIAIASGLKIYPAIFGLMYIKEKRWKESIRLIIYGLIIFFVPFTLSGGMSGFKAYLNILLTFGKMRSIRWTNVKNYLFALLYTFGINIEVISSAGLQFVEIVYLFLMLASFMATKDKWKNIFYLTVIPATFVPNSHRYVAVYMVIPLIMYFVYDEQNSEKNAKYLMVFSIIFSTPWLGYLLGLNADFCIFTPIYICIIMSLAEDFVLCIIGSLAARKK
jgi:hypothetical protein